MTKYENLFEKDYLKLLEKYNNKSKKIKNLNINIAYYKKDMRQKKNN